MAGKGVERIGMARPARWGKDGSGTAGLARQEGLGVARSSKEWMGRTG
jgi:hypothetical protein